MRELFHAQRLPVLQNKVFSSRKEALACPTGDIILVQDNKTGLIYNQVFDTGLIQYDSSYQNEQAVSGVFQEHLNEVMQIIKRHFPLRSIAEIGCGKARFLERLNRAGYDVIGFDPAYEGDDTRVVKSNFEQGMGISADGIVMRHILEHVANPLEFLADVTRANGGRGVGYIEIPCLEWIGRNRTWFDIFYEHVNYFRLSDFHRMFSRIYESGHCFNGQYIYAVADLTSLRTPRFYNKDRYTLPDDFLSGIALARNKAMLARHNAVWGGASKGVIFSLYMQRAGVELDFAIDINPAKQGRYMAGSGIHILPPAEAIEQLEDSDNVFIMNSNYLPEIASQSGNRFNYHSVDNYEFQ